MPTHIEYAALAAIIYNDQRGGGSLNTTQTNRLQPPPGWQDIGRLGFTTGVNLNINPFSFTAGAYVNAAGEIVISYKGTDFLTQYEGRSWNTVADLVADVGLASTIRNFNIGQQLYASSYFLAVKEWAVQNGYDASKISFTGHSLGGGLASNMAVWFDRSATTFAEGPFELGAKDPLAIVAAAAALTLQAGVTASAAVLAEILTLQSAYANFATREAKVTNYAIGGEFLGYLREYIPTVVGIDNRIDIGDQPLSRGVSLHSMNLHLALLLDDRLRVACTTIPELVPALLDKSLYASDPNFAKEDLVTRLVASQLQGSVTRQDGSLGKFIADILKLDVADGMLAQPSVRTGLLAVAMEYYYFKDAASTTAIFTTSGNGIHFKYGDIGVPMPGLKSPRLLGEAMQPFLGTEEWTNVGYRLSSQDSWHIQTGTSGMIWTATGSDKDAAIGGAQTDILDAGAGDDILVGGAGQDFLTGGANNDTLIGGVDLDWLDGGEGDDKLLGGQGADIYHFTAGWGVDTIEDSDGQGSIVVDGVTLDGANARLKSEGGYTDGQWLYTLVPNGRGGNDLILERVGTVDKIRIRDWSEARNLGITLNNTAATVAANNVFDGEFIKKTGTDGVTYVKGSDGNYVNAGAAANTKDDINGTAGNDKMTGGGNTDGLAGLAGDDDIDGGDGDDLLVGGVGADWLKGGAGNDRIFGSGGGITLIGSSAQAPVADGPELLRGASWVVYQAPVPDSYGSYVTWYRNVGLGAGDTGSNVVDGGAGNDWVAAGTGDDVVRGGAGQNSCMAWPGATTSMAGASSDYSRVACVRQRQRQRAMTRSSY